MLTSRTNMTIFALCPSSHFQHNFPPIIHEGVEDFMVYFFFGGGCSWLVLTSRTKIKFWVALCPSSNFQHNFPLIIHEGVQYFMISFGVELVNVDLAHQNDIFCIMSKFAFST